MVLVACERAVCSHSAGASGVPEGKSAARWLLSSASALTLRHLVTKITSSRGQIRFSPKFSVFARNWTSVRSVRSGPRSCRPRVFLERDPLLSPPLLRVTAPYVVSLRWVPVSVRDRRSGDSVWLTRTLRGNRIDASPGAAAPRWARLRVFGCVCSGSTTQRRTPRVK